jgi:Resolvase, N terminal domain
VTSYLNGGRWTLVAEYVETESGRKSDRPKPAAALSHAQAIGAKLVFGKLDRLTRNVDLLRSLVASEADLAFCDLPSVPPGPMGKFLLERIAATDPFSLSWDSPNENANNSREVGHGLGISTDLGHPGSGFFENEQVSQSIDEALTASENRGGDGSQTSGKEDVAAFLTVLLAAGPVDVHEVEREVRLAGLLDETKRIRGNKSFRTARKLLGVRSVREGFGQRARYVLSLPGAPCAPEKPMGARSRDGAHMENTGAHAGIEGGDVIGVTGIV